MNKSAFFSTFFALTTLLSGCMGYQLGNSRPAGIDTVAISPVINRTDEPALELQISHALRESIQFDGRMKLLNSAEAADGILEVTLTKYDLKPIAFRDKKRTTPQLYRLRVTGKAILKRADTGAVLSSVDAYGEAVLPFQSDLTSTKRDALPGAAGEFAKYVLDDLFEQW